ncbi:CPBP family intramembrane glutamic endopeptidase [Rhodococcus sp. IEGM 1408]|uniref:CPBP family intramembrane glutamic endopeptidase n=1 Tax=Rhodococcus sp. IEGM 1408 TaxID=3082220 RepID=UPI002952BDFB|nr:CPBP family intramembrane glutamic endopeptidase [Rhodococcus sp. IEGM 1408]MDV8001202.1 CPBP family intramembrane glutamic endopeptidase [Rhodococcus sp. IEGM 1408]
MSDTVVPATLVGRYRQAWRTGEMETAPVPPTRRRLVVVVLTLVVGAAVGAWALRIPAGDGMFYPATSLLASVWLIGAFASGPIRVGREPYRAGRPVLSSILTAAALAALFCLGALVVARIEPLRDPVDALLDHATVGNLALVALLTAVNGVAEECFHRGAVYSATSRLHPVLVTTVVYGAVTAASGIPLLVLAAVILGAVTAVQRRCTGGILGPIITHVAWSMVMLFALGPILDAARV